LPSLKNDVQKYFFKNHKSLILESFILSM